MTKTCTLVPIHPPKFEFGINLLQSFSELINSKLYFIFSNKEEYNSFKKLTSKENLKFDYLIVNPPPAVSIINYKKLFGVFYLFNTFKFDYIAVLDSESEVVKSFDSDKVYSTIFNSSTIKANKTLKGDFITKHNVELLGLNSSKKIISETENLSLYWWFNDICIYEKNTFFEFLKFYNSHKNFNTIRNSHWCFDWFVYSLWLIEYQDWKIVKPLNDEVFNWGAIEHNRRDDVSLAFKSIADSNPNHKNLEHIKIIIQKDRII
jgi:hypothetical protein